MSLIAQIAVETAPDDTFLVIGIVCICVAVLVAILEVFVPSGGLLALLGAASAVAAIVSFFLYDALVGVVMLGLTLILGPLAAWGLFKLWISSPIARRMILAEDGESITTGNRASFAKSEMDRAQRVQELQKLIGSEGETLTTLRPVGTVRIAGRRLDGMAESGIIEAGTAIVVTDVYDNQVKVRPL